MPVAEERINALVVDDHTGLAEEISDSLRAAGIPSQGVTDPEDALNIVRLQGPDVAALDLRMPEFDGIDLAKRMQEIQKDLEIVFFSAYNSPEYRERAIREGIRVKLWLEKSDKTDDVVQAVASTLQQKQIKYLVDTIERRLVAAGAELNLSRDHISELVRKADIRALYVPTGIGKPYVAREIEGQTAPILAFADVLSIITSYLDEVALGFLDPSLRETAWDRVRSLATSQLWPAAEGTGHRYIKQLAVQFELAVSKIVSPLLRREHLEAAHIVIERMKSSVIDEADVAACKRQWDLAGVNTLPSLEEMLKDPEWEKLYEYEDEEDD